MGAESCPAVESKTVLKAEGLSNFNSVRVRELNTLSDCEV